MVAVRWSSVAVQRSARVTQCRSWVAARKHARRERASEGDERGPREMIRRRASGVAAHCRHQKRLLGGGGSLLSCLWRNQPLRHTAYEWTSAYERIGHRVMRERAAAAAIARRRLVLSRPLPAARRPVARGGGPTRARCK